MLIDGCVKLPIEGGKLHIGEAGFYLEPWFTADAVSVPWTNISFVCTIPSLKRRGNGWSTYKDEAVTVDTLNSGLRFYTIMPALKDRHAVESGCSPAVRSWLKGRAGLQGLGVWDESDKVHPIEGFMELNLKQRVLWGARPSPQHLLTALELIERHSRFDLIVLDWEF